MTLTLRHSIDLQHQSKMKYMKQYSVQKLAKIAGVSVRTLHLYDQKGLLKPHMRTETRYRMYGEKELLRLQQILFYKELDFSLQEIKEILNRSDFDLASALQNHRAALEAKHRKIETLLITIDKTIIHLKNGGNMLQDEELYEGLSKEQADAYRNEAIEKWGKETVEKSEFQLKKMSKAELDILKTEFLEIGKQLGESVNEEPTSRKIQSLIAKHYECICKFWGTKPTAEAYIGLGELYVSDNRYTLQNNISNEAFAPFMSKAMKFYAEIYL